MVLALPCVSEACLILRVVQLGTVAAVALMIRVCRSRAYTLTAYPVGCLLDHMPRMRMFACCRHGGGDAAVI